MDDAEWGRWSKRALDDLSIGCVRNDTDNMVKFLYDKTKKNMELEYQRKKEWYEKNKNKKSEEESKEDAPTREDGEFKSDSGNAGNLESATSSDNSGEGSSENVRERTSAKELPSPIVKTDPKPVKTEKVEVKPPSAKHPHGEFGNIMLTTDEYIKLCERLDNADELINEADQYFEAQPDKAKKYKSHYAMLLSWDRRRKDVERPKQGFMTSDDISRRNAEESHRRLAAMFGRNA